jgi:hypothetical protein
LEQSGKSIEEFRDHKVWWGNLLAGGGMEKEMDIKWGRKKYVKRNECAAKGMEKVVSWAQGE